MANSKANVTTSLGCKLAWLCLGTSYMASSTRQNSSVIKSLVDIRFSCSCGLSNNSFREPYVFVKLAPLVSYDFLLGAGPSSISIPHHGGTARYSVNVTPVNGFTGTVTLAVDG